MQNEIYKFTFPLGVHFGKKDIAETEITFCADTLFSALFQEALRTDEKVCLEFLNGVKTGKLLFSDGFPCIGEQLYLPKPFLAIQREKSDEGSKKKKAAKKLKYLPAEKLPEFLEGKMDVEKEVEILGTLGKKEEKVCAAIRGEEETKPYRVGIYRFSENNGLSVCVRTSEEKYSRMFEKLLASLQFSGIGGERSSGYGRFVYRKYQAPDYLERRFEQPAKQYMTLACCMAKDEELDRSMENACFQLKKRSGFIDSPHRGEQNFRKKDFYAFAAGSCFREKFEGDIFDVSRNGSHPVYRYAKGLFIGVI